MGLIPEAGEIYESPKFDRYISVLAIDKEDSSGYTLAILWVDKKTNQTEPGDLVVTHGDVDQWRQVNV